MSDNNQKVNDQLFSPLAPLVIYLELLGALRKNPTRNNPKRNKPERNNPKRNNPASYKLRGSYPFPD